MEQMMEKWGGGEVLKKAVRGMLPKNRLRDRRMERLKVFEGVAHPYKKNIVRQADQSTIPEQPASIVEEVSKLQASKA